jgi:heptosyltransferase-2
MATPAMRALREHYPDAHITWLCRRYVKPVLSGLPYADRILTYRSGKKAKHVAAGRGDNVIRLAARLRRARFDLAILLSNSFKTALICRLAKIRKVVGYDRDGRGLLLSDRLLPHREKGKFTPTPILRYYMGLVQYLGSRQRNLAMELAITPGEAQRARAILEGCGLDAHIDRPASQGGRPLVMVNPGAQYGAAKCWLPEHFAAVADRLVEETGATIVLSGAPRERRIIDSILRHMTHDAVDLSQHGLTLGSLKDIVRRCDLMITNDTGPRHIAAALAVPVVTVFGPTHPEWTEIDFDLERKVSVKVFCGPCQKKVCPLDHRCMKLITPAAVLQAATELLKKSPAACAR